MEIFCDIDQTICDTPVVDGQHDYAAATPFVNRIKRMNQLYDEGHEIVYWTARGSSTGIDWTDLTQAQLQQWGVKYHEIRMRKPSYDVFICDKAVNDKDFFDGNT